ncbi:MAG: ATP-binding protein [Chlorobi bacterium]|nr:MAG: anti-sigma regulatory factor, serine/threonine protein kinase [Chlorobi bacterium OLB7]MBK8912318.1 ATP-binding protein [Chlorobiota bacterium]
MNNSGTILLQKRFFTDKGELSLLLRELERLRPQMPLSNDQFHNLVIAMTEAVNNAIVHGNQLDPSKSVFYQISATEDGVFCTIEDEGEGFTLEDLANPISPENLLMESGRGMFIIGALMRDLKAVKTERGMRVEFLCAAG